MKTKHIILSLTLLACAAGWFPFPSAAADFKAELFGEPSRIFANIVTQDVNTGYVQINGVAMDLAAQPLWDFGDGIVVGSWFPAEHTYASTGSNYIVKVTGYFTDGAPTRPKCSSASCRPSSHRSRCPTNSL